MKKNNYSYFENRDCQYFPCHETNGECFNCMFCYCPLYALGDRCGGDFTYIEGTVKDCSKCMLPHSEMGYDYILMKYSEVALLAKKNKSEE